MAGKTIYTGDMIAALQDKIDTMTATLQAHTTALGNINTAVGQQIISGNAKASDTVKLTATHSEISSTPSTYVEVCRAKLFVNGKVRFKMTGKSTGGTNGLYYSVDGGTTKVAIKTGMTSSYVEYALDVNVLNLQEVIFYIYVSSAGTTNAQANSTKICFDLVNLVTDGYVFQS